MDNQYIIDIFNEAQTISAFVKDKQDLSIKDVENLRTVAFEIIARLDYIQEEKECE